MKVLADATPDLADATRALQFERGLRIGSIWSEMNQWNWLTSLPPIIFITRSHGGNGGRETGVLRKAPRLYPGRSEEMCDTAEKGDSDIGRIQLPPEPSDEDGKSILDSGKSGTCGRSAEFMRKITWLTQRLLTAPGLMLHRGVVSFMTWESHHFSARYLVGSIDQIFAMQTTVHSSRPKQPGSESMESVSVDDQTHSLVQFENGCRGSLRQLGCMGAQDAPFF